MFVLPTSTAPATRNRSTTVASSSGTKSASTRELAVVRIPFVKNRSFTETGTPCSGPRYAPPKISRSASRASTIARSPSTVMKALKTGSSASIRVNTRSVTSTGERPRLRIRSATATSGRSQRSSRVRSIAVTKHPVIESERGCRLCRRVGHGIQLPELREVRLRLGDQRLPPLLPKLDPHQRG